MADTDIDSLENHAFCLVKELYIYIYTILTSEMLRESMRHVILPVRIYDEY